MRQEAAVRLRAQSNELKRFHDKICVRVTARERQNRLDAQRAQNHLVRDFTAKQFEMCSELTVLVVDVK